MHSPAHHIRAPRGGFWYGRGGGEASSSVLIIHEGGAPSAAFPNVTIKVRLREGQSSASPPDASCQAPSTLLRGTKASLQMEQSPLALHDHPPSLLPSAHLPRGRRLRSPHSASLDIFRLQVMRSLPLPPLPSPCSFSSRSPLPGEARSLCHSRLATGRACSFPPASRSYLGEGEGRDGGRGRKRSRRRGRRRMAGAPGGPRRLTLARASRFCQGRVGTRSPGGREVLRGAGEGCPARSRLLRKRSRKAARSASGQGQRPGRSPRGFLLSRRARPPSRLVASSARCGPSPLSFSGRSSGFPSRARSHSRQATIQQVSGENTLERLLFPRASSLSFGWAPVT